VGDGSVVVDVTVARAELDNLVIVGNCPVYLAHVHIGDAPHGAAFGDLIVQHDGVPVSYLATRLGLPDSNRCGRHLTVCQSRLAEQPWLAPALFYLAIVIALLATLGLAHDMGLLSRVAARMRHSHLARAGTHPADGEAAVNVAVPLSSSMRSMIRGSRRMVGMR
jgi:hypothetical protein